MRNIQPNILEKMNEQESSPKRKNGINVTFRASSKRQPHLQTELKAVVNTLPTWDAKRILVQLISTIELKVV